MTSSQRYRPNMPHVIFENIDNEIVLVNLVRGHYFSMQGTAAELWECVQNEASHEEMLGILQSRYEGNQQEIQKAIDSYVNELLDADLVVASPSAASEVRDTVVSGENENRVPFQTPVIESYKDMEDLLLLDPIHEVDESGWPNKHTIDPDSNA